MWIDVVRSELSGPEVQRFLAFVIVVILCIRDERSMQTHLFPSTKEQFSHKRAHQHKQQVTTLGFVVGIPQNGIICNFACDFEQEQTPTWRSMQKKQKIKIHSPKPNRTAVCLGRKKKPKPVQNKNVKFSFFCLVLRSVGSLL